MGVIRLPGQRNEEHRNTWNVDNIIQELQNRTHIGELSSLSDDEIERRERVERNRERRQRLQSRRCTRVKPEDTFRALGARGKSHKKHRRFENANLLGFQQNFDHDEIFDELSINDFVESSVTAFSRLFKEKENMKIWNDFIERAEDEQDILLNKKIDDDDEEEEDEFNLDENLIAGHHKRDNKQRLHSSGSTGDDENGNGDEMKLRKVHPAFSPKDAFNQINNELKSLLRKRHVPIGLLEAIQDDLIEFFENHPNADYECCLATGYQRLLLHACSQYLNLICRSFDRQGLRWSRVHNSSKQFNRPPLLLSDFLSSNNTFS